MSISDIETNVKRYYSQIYYLGTTVIYAILTHNVFIITPSGVFVFQVFIAKRLCTCSLDFTSSIPQLNPRWTPVDSVTR